MKSKNPWWYPEMFAEDFCGYADCQVPDFSSMPYEDFLFAHEQMWAIRKGLA